MIVYWGSFALIPFSLLALAGVIRRPGLWTGLVLAVLLLGLWTRFIEPNWIITREATIAVGGKARLALISDIHLGVFKGRVFLDRVVDRLNALDVDAVLIAGDLTGEPAEPLDYLFAPLARLRHPTYAVLGNHDEQRPGPPLGEELRRVLARYGVTVIEGKAVPVGGITLVGLGDRWAGKDSPSFVATLPHDRPIVLLTHNPDTAMDVPAGTAALLLAGHTHGGQVRLPFLYRRMIPAHPPFDRGLVDWQGLPVYVTSGLGETGLPLRFLNPPVIDVLTLE
ncbi:metallophosphoesterase [Oleomonas cavernae]|nr:metallophosphoesterase [Oleomonas cavernae]